MRVSIHPEGLTTYAATTTALAADLAAAATHTATATADRLAPAFGLIGADLLTAYATAHTTHRTTLTHLAALLTTTSAATTTAHDTYTHHDIDHATRLRTAAMELDA